MIVSRHFRHVGALQNRCSRIVSPSCRLIPDRVSASALRVQRRKRCRRLRHGNLFGNRVLGSVCVSQKAATLIQRRDLVFVMRNRAVGLAELNQLIAQSGNTERRTKRRRRSWGCGKSAFYQSNEPCLNVGQPRLILSARRQEAETETVGSSDAEGILA